jgi:hypothetical protein
MDLYHSRIVENIQTLNYNCQGYGSEHVHAFAMICCLGYCSEENDDYYTKIKMQPVV